MIGRLCKGHSTHFTSGTIRLAPLFIISPKAGLRSSGDVQCDPRPLVLEAQLHVTLAVLQYIRKSHALRRVPSISVVKAV